MLSKEEILNLAKLSKLEFNEEELVIIQNKINDLMEYVDQLNNVDTTDVEPLFNVLDLKDRMREDKVVNNHFKKDFLNNASEKDDDFIIVPKVVG